MNIVNSQTCTSKASGYVLVGYACTVCTKVSMWVCTTSNMSLRCPCGYVLSHTRVCTHYGVNVGMYFTHEGMYSLVWCSR